MWHGWDQLSCVHVGVMGIVSYWTLWGDLSKRVLHGYAVCCRLGDCGCRRHVWFLPWIQGAVFCGGQRCSACCSQWLEMHVFCFRLTLLAWSHVKHYIVLFTNECIETVVKLLRYVFDYFTHLTIWIAFRDRSSGSCNWELSHDQPIPSSADSCDDFHAIEQPSRSVQLQRLVESEASKGKINIVLGDCLLWHSCVTLPTFVICKASDNLSI